MSRINNLCTFLTVLLLALSMQGCSGIEIRDPAPVATVPAGRCLSNRDCPAWDVCEHPDRHYPCGTCMEDPSLDECGSENACPEGKLCVQVSPPCYCGYNVCVESCETSGCPAGQYCSEDGICQALACKTGDDCGGAYCIAGFCSQELGYCEGNEPRP